MTYRRRIGQELGYMFVARLRECVVVIENELFQPLVATAFAQARKQLKSVGSIIGRQL